MVDAFCDHVQENVEDPMFTIHHYKAFCRSRLGVKITKEQASKHLQIHRLAQKREEPPRHVIACQNYGAGAWWQMKDHRNAVDQYEWSLNDSSKRLLTDAMVEVMPALRGHPKQKALVNFVISSVESTIKQALTLIRESGWGGQSS